MPDGLLLSELAALAQVVLIDLTLAGDNAVVVGLAVTGLPVRQRRLAILVGVGGAALLRIGFGAVTLQLLQIVGLLLAGGILLLWVCWKMFRELRRSAHGHVAAAPRSLRAAILQIILADVSMSLDNVLAVAGAAEGHLWVLALGLGLSVVLMGIAANLVARLLERHRWIAWIGLLIVLTVALRLIWDGGWEVADHMAPASG
jgi:YjbE family integral membrane protein